MGTNSTRLLVADVDDGRAVAVHRESRVTGLGRGVETSGGLATDAIDRVLDAVGDYLQTAERLGASEVVAFATSAVRDAENGSVFLAELRERFSLPASVLDGLEEARLTYRGALSDHPGQGETLVVDIGGGSTEFVLGDGSGVRAARSVDIGCVRLTERHLRGDPPTAEEIGRAEADIRSALDQVRAEVPVDEAVSLVGLAGSVTTVAALALALPAYDADAIHGSRIAVDDVRAVTADLLAATRARRAAMPVMHPGRVDVIGAGSLILRVLMDEFGAAEVVVSEHDILDGIALRLARG